MTRHTPGVGGYLLVWALSALYCGLLLGVVGVLDGADAGWLLVGSLVVTVYAAVFSLPAAPVGLVVLHLVCRRVPAQAVHVLVAAVVGGVAGAAYSAWLFDGWPAMVPVLAAAVGLARLSVVRLVPAVRERRGLPTLSAAALVDDDFRTGPPAR